MYFKKLIFLFNSNILLCCCDVVKCNGVVICLNARFYPTVYGTLLKYDFWVCFINFKFCSVSAVLVITVYNILDWKRTPNVNFCWVNLWHWVTEWWWMIWSGCGRRRPGLVRAVSTYSLDGSVENYQKPARSFDVVSHFLTGIYRVWSLGPAGAVVTFMFAFQAVAVLNIAIKSCIYYCATSAVSACSVVVP